MNKHNVDMENFHKQTKHQLFDYCTHIHNFIPLPKHNKPKASTLIQITIYVITVHIQFMVYALIQYKQMPLKYINTLAFIQVFRTRLTGAYVEKRRVNHENSIPLLNSNDLNSHES